MAIFQRGDDAKDSARVRSDDGAVACLRRLLGVASSRRRPFQVLLAEHGTQCRVDDERIVFGLGH